MQFTKKSQSLMYLTASENDLTEKRSRCLMRSRYGRKICISGILLSVLTLLILVCFIVFGAKKKAVQQISSQSAVLAEKLINKESWRLTDSFPNSSDASTVSNTVPSYNTPSTEILLSALQDRLTELENNTAMKFVLMDQKFEEQMLLMKKILSKVENISVKVENSDESLHALKEEILTINATSKSMQEEIKSTRKSLNKTVSRFKEQTFKSNQLFQQQQVVYSQVQNSIADLNNQTTLIENKLNETRLNLFASHEIFQQRVNTSVNHIINLTRFSAQTASSFVENKLLSFGEQLNETVWNLITQHKSDIERNNVEVKRFLRNETDRLHNEIISNYYNLQSMSLQYKDDILRQCQMNVNNTMQRITRHLITVCSSCRNNDYVTLNSKVQKLQIGLNEKTSRIVFRTQMTSLNRTVTKNTKDLQVINQRMLSFKKVQLQPGWIRTPSGYAYFVTKEKDNWDGSRRACQALSADLAHAGLRVSTQMYQYIFENVLKSLHSKVWIGLTDKAVENRWTWVDGRPLTSSSSHWSSRQPNNFNGNQDCVEMDSQGKWGDFSCSGVVSAYALCEKKISGYF